MAALLRSEGFSSFNRAQEVLLIVTPVNAKVAEP
jgi:hypothetical protein